MPAGPLGYLYNLYNNGIIKNPAKTKTAKISGVHKGEPKYFSAT
jgi:hypothetical protein